jgi:tRNA A-37 threonylcarbamoyl transferase component Bud32
MLEVLGDGAFASVYVARRRDDPLRRLLAVKVLKSEYLDDDKILHRTRDEARLLSQLHHPNIVRVEQLTEVGRCPVLVMELVQGVSIKRLLQRASDGVPAAVALEVARQTAVALHAAYHQALGVDGRPLRVIHRDIKPGNVLLSIHGAVKVVDFGIATGQFLEREAQTESVVMGSRPYMAPERLDGRADTPAVDVYALGVMTLEMLVGRGVNLSVRPSDHQRILDATLAHVDPPGMDAGSVGALHRLLRAMVAYEPTDRPTAVAVATELRRLLDGLDPAHTVKLEAWAHEVVEPLFHKTKGVTSAVTQLEDEALFTSIFGEMEPQVRVARLGRRPAAFLGGIGGMLLALVALAWHKTSEEVTAAEVPSEKPVVRLWFPDGVDMWSGDEFLPEPGQLRLAPGRHVLQVDDEAAGRRTCTVDISGPVVVRYIEVRGSPAVTLDDGPPVPCLAVSTTEGAKDKDRGAEGSLR